MSNAVNVKSDIPFQLMQDGTVLGTLMVQSTDQPWFICSFAATSAFSNIQPLFDEEAQLIAVPTSSQEARDASRYLRQQIRALHLRLVFPDGEADDFIIHIDGGRAWFRFRDPSRY